jgi:hypothetical protein
VHCKCSFSNISGATIMGSFLKGCRNFAPTPPPTQGTHM